MPVDEVHEPEDMHWRYACDTAVGRVQGQMRGGVACFGCFEVVVKPDGRPKDDIGKLDVHAHNLVDRASLFQELRLDYERAGNVREPVGGDVVADEIVGDLEETSV